jgi:hypothetical protein
MIGGDLSNEVPKRVAVSVDCILVRTPTIKKILGVIPYSDEEVEYNRQIISLVWNFAFKQDITLELVGFGYSVKDMEAFMEDLDRIGTNPFKYAKAYKVVADLVAELPYRHELLYVIDIPSRGLRYGGRYLDMRSI